MERGTGTGGAWRSLMGAALAALVAVGGVIAAGHPDEGRMLVLVNGERVSRGLPPLEWDEALARLARRHARDMRSMRKTTHLSSRDGADFGERLARTAYRAQAAAENVAFDRDMRRAHRGLMRSPGHRANILDERLSAVGIGIVEDHDGRSVWVVQDFATPIADLSDSGARRQVVEALRAARRQRGGNPLEEDGGLSRLLAASLERMIASDSVEIPEHLVSGPAWVIAYTTMDPEELPEEARKRVGRA